MSSSFCGCICVTENVNIKATDDARSRAPRKHKHSKVMARMKNIVESPIEALMEKREERSRKLV